MHAAIKEEETSEKMLVQMLCSAADAGEEVCFIEVDVDDLQAFVAHPLMYMKKALATDKSREINFRHLTPERKKLFEEAMAREVCEVLQGQALRALNDEAEAKQAEWMRDRTVAMRWILTWKPVNPPQPPPVLGPTAITQDGHWQAKARVVLIG